MPDHPEPRYTEEQIREGLLSKEAIDAGLLALPEISRRWWDALPAEERQNLRRELRAEIESALDHFTQQPVGVGADGQSSDFGSLPAPDSEPRSADSDGNKQIEAAARELEQRAEGYAEETGIPSAYRDAAEIVRARFGNTQPLGGDADAAAVSSPGSSVLDGRGGSGQGPGSAPVSADDVKGILAGYEQPAGDRVEETARELEREAAESRRAAASTKDPQAMAAHNGRAQALDWSAKNLRSLTQHSSAGQEGGTGGNGLSQEGGVEEGAVERLSKLQIAELAVEAARAAAPVFEAREWKWGRHDKAFVPSERQLAETAQRLLEGAQESQGSHATGRLEAHVYVQDGVEFAEVHLLIADGDAEQSSDQKRGKG